MLAAENFQARSLETKLTESTRSPGIYSLDLAVINKDNYASPANMGLFALIIKTAFTNVRRSIYNGRTEGRQR